MRPPSTLFWDEDNYHLQHSMSLKLVKNQTYKNKVKERVSGSPGMTSDIIGLTVEPIVVRSGAPGPNSEGQGRAAAGACAGVLGH